jgi:hypothetical protein
MGVASGLYKVLLVLHLIAVVVGIGGVTLGGVYGALSKQRQGPEGLAISEANLHVATRWAEWFIYAIPVFGILLVLVSDDAIEFQDTWIWVSLLLFAAVLGFVHAAHYPNLRRMNGLMAELVAMGPPPAAAGPGPGAAPAGPPPQVLELEERGRRAGLYGGILHLASVIFIVLMVWKPGT